MARKRKLIDLTARMAVNKFERIFQKSCNNSNVGRRYSEPVLLHNASEIIHLCAHCILCVVLNQELIDGPFPSVNLALACYRYHQHWAVVLVPSL